MYLQHPIREEGKYYALIDKEKHEITRETANAMNYFHKKSYSKTYEGIDENGRREMKSRELSFGVSMDDGGEEITIEDFPAPDCNPEDIVIDKIEREEKTVIAHKLIKRLDKEERLIIYEIFFKNTKQRELAEEMKISQQMLAYKLQRTLNKMRGMLIE